jgi:ABC-type antimicrobial peptide transport system permease subunit
MIRRGQELGVRLALGATPARVVLGDLRRQAPIYAVSGIIGLPVGLLVMRAASVVAAPLAMPTMTALLASWAIAILVAAAISATMTLRAIRFEPINLFRQSAN